MGNAIAESGLNPEAQSTDSNGYTSSGLWQFNAQSYPGSESLVTGNPVKDLTAQVGFLAQTGGLKAATGNTPAEVASNFAANYERCQTCQAGGQSNTQRAGYAAQVAGWASSGNWPATASQASTTAQLTGAQAQGSDETCAWEIGFGPIAGTSWLTRIFSLGQQGGNISIGSVCLLSKSQARALLSAGILVAGAGLFLFGISTLTGITSGVLGVATKVAPLGRVASAASAASGA
jgi:hypothetical protein